MPLKRRQRIFQTTKQAPTEPEATNFVGEKEVTAEEEIPPESERVDILLLHEASQLLAESLKNREPLVAT